MTLRLSLVSAGRPRGRGPARIAWSGAFAGWDAVRGPGTECARAAALAGLAEPVPVDDGLDDWDLGRWAGRDVDDLAGAEPDLVEQWLSDPAFDGHGGESLVVLLERAGRWLDDTAARRGGRLVVVAPGPWVRAAVCVTAGRCAARVLARWTSSRWRSWSSTLRPGRRALRWSA